MGQCYIPWMQTREGYFIYEPWKCWWWFNPLPSSPGSVADSWRCRDACTGLKLECFNVLRPTPLLSMKPLKPWKCKGKPK